MNLSESQVYWEIGFWAGRIKRDVEGFIKEQVGLGRKVYVYGALTKGNTLLQYYGLDHSLIGSAADRNPEKWSKTTRNAYAHHFRRGGSGRQNRLFSCASMALYRRIPSSGVAIPFVGREVLLPAPHFTLI